MRHQLNWIQANKVGKMIFAELKNHDIVSIEIPTEPELDAIKEQVKVFIFRDGREIERGMITMAQAFSL
jgi:hypothetical protein